MSLTFSTMASLRFGTGFRPGEAAPDSVEALLAQLDGGRRETLLFPDGGLTAARDRITDTARQSADLRQYGKNQDAAAKRAARVRYRAALNILTLKDEHARFMQGVLSPNGFNERLASFWSNHFSVNSRKSEFMRLLVPVYEAEAIRPNMGGRFADLAAAAVLHPAMLLYLDQVQSFGPTSPQGVKQQKGLNENLGRELLELHTLGAGSGYTQTDVRNAAFVLTGMTINRKTYQARYAANIAEPGTRLVFGESYGGNVRRQGDVLAMIENLAAAPETRQHLCHKIARHFLADTPPPEVVDAMSSAWQRHDGDLTAVYTAMLQHPRSWEADGQKAKLPFDYIVSGLRALSANATDMADLGLADAKARTKRLLDDGDSMSAMGDDAMMASAAPLQRIRPNPLTVQAAIKLGQPLWQPPSPAGFDDGFAAWIAGGPLADRIAWARLAAAKLGGNRDPRAFLKETLRDAARQDTIDIVSKAPNRQMGIALALASPEFNRR